MISAFPAASGTALLRVAIATALTLLMHGAGAQDRPAETKVRLVVGGKSAIFYLPLAVTERLGYFKERGIDAEIADVQSGARALQSLIGGSADVGVGTFDHTIQMQAKGQPVVAVLQYGLYPGFVLGTLASKAIAYAGPQSLKGLKIGVTSPGSSTHFMAAYMLVRSGFKADDASFIGIGVTSTAVAAARRGEIDALVSSDPMISLMQSLKGLKIGVTSPGWSGSWPTPAPLQAPRPSMAAPIPEEWFTQRLPLSSAILLRCKRS